MYECKLGIQAALTDINNNHPNFGDPTSIVGRVQPGTGLLIMAADRTTVTENEIRGNDSFGVAVVGLMGSSLTLVVLTLGLLLWDRFAVVARATTMQVRTLDYVNAAWCAGASTAHVLTREILPNIASHLAVVATLLHRNIVHYEWILAGLVLGSGIGVAISAWIPMTKMPERIAFSHAFGGLATALVGVAEYLREGDQLTYFKTGALPSQGLFNEVARLERGPLAFTVAVFTDGDPSMAYGEETIEGVAARLLGASG